MYIAPRGCWKRKWLGWDYIVVHLSEREQLTGSLAPGGQTTTETCVRARVKEDDMEKEKCLCLWSGRTDSCLSLSARGMNGKCKHHHCSQKTENASLSSGNVGLSSWQAEKKRQMILSAVLTDYFHSALKCPGSCCWCFWLRCFQSFSHFWHTWRTKSVSVLQLLTRIDLGLCYHMTWSDDSWRTWSNNRGGSKTETLFTNRYLSYRSGGECLWWQTGFYPTTNNKEN